MKHVLRYLPRVVVALVAAASLVLASAAHRGDVARSALANAELATFLSSGGSLHDLCLANRDHPPEGHDQPCPACLIAKMLGAPPPSVVPIPTTTAIRAGQPPAHQRVVVPSCAAPLPARGPPAISV